MPTSDVSWCGRRDLNPHSQGEADFKAAMGANVFNAYSDRFSFCCPMDTCGFPGFVGMASRLFSCAGG